MEKIREGSPRALAQAITAVEDRTRESYELLRALFPYSGRARIVGLTGAPGSGKAHLPISWRWSIASARRSVGIVAVDPTSPFTEARSWATASACSGTTPILDLHSQHGHAGSLGGLARTTADVASVLDASGRDVVLIETVGVGQDEVDIVRLADVTLVILVPGMGDDVQSIKAGIMEIADIFVVNKSDRDERRSGRARDPRLAVDCSAQRRLAATALLPARLDAANYQDRRQRRPRHLRIGYGHRSV